MGVKGRFDAVLVNELSAVVRGIKKSVEAEKIKTEKKTNDKEMDPFI